MYCSKVTKIFHVNEPLYYENFSKEFLTYNVSGCLSDLLYVFPTYIDVEFLWDMSLTHGRGALLKKIIIDDSAVVESRVSEEEILKRIDKINLREELLKYMERTGWEDQKYKELSSV